MGASWPAWRANSHPLTCSRTSPDRVGNPTGNPRRAARHLMPGEAEDHPASGGQLGVPFPVRLEGAAAAVVRPPVHLDVDAVLDEGEVELVGAIGRVHEMVEG